MSSASSVCQGLQSCLEPLLLDPSVLLHQWAPTKQALSSPMPQKEAELPRAECSRHCAIEKTCASSRNGEKSNDRWTLIKSLTNQRKLTDEAVQVYVHPLVRRSSSSLSTRSLEMCTESLGSETGSSITETSIDEISTERSRRTKSPKNGESCKKGKQASTFPPPLTSINGSDGVQVRTHRDGGRLLIKAFSFSSGSPCFQAERENGRLRLSLMKDRRLDSDPELGDDEGEEEEEEEEEREGGGEEEEDENVEESSDEDELNEGILEGKIERKIRGKEWSSSSRCNEDRNGNKRLQSLPCCVAIST